MYGATMLKTDDSTIKRYHYTYRITNKELNKHYYGVHSCVCSPREDIGVKYFSSSRDSEFIKDQKENPKRYKYKIIKIFCTRIEAIEHEIYLHNKFDVGRNNKFYNNSKQTSTGFDTTGRCVVKDSKGNTLLVNTTDSRFLSGELVSISKGKTRDHSGSKNPNYGKITSQETKNKISHTLRNNGYTDSVETRLKKSISAKNRPPVTKETRDKISKIHKGKKVSSEVIAKRLSTRKSREYGPNYNSLNVDIKNENGEVIFRCLNNFNKICKENNLPCSALRNSIKTKKPIYINLSGGNLAKITNKGWLKYKGWIVELRGELDE